MRNLGYTMSRLSANHPTLPRVVLMDLQLPGMGGIAATAALRAYDPSARVLIFSTFARDDEIQAALDAGALGYLHLLVSGAIFRGDGRGRCCASALKLAQTDATMPAGRRRASSRPVGRPVVMSGQRETATGPTVAPWFESTNT